MERHGMICQTCAKFTVEQSPEMTLVNSCPHANVLTRHETSLGKIRESCPGGYIPKEPYEGERDGEEYDID